MTKTQLINIFLCSLSCQASPNCFGPQCDVAPGLSNGTALLQRTLKRKAWEGEGEVDDDSMATLNAADQDEETEVEDDTEGIDEGEVEEDSMENSTTEQSEEDSLAITEETEDHYLARVETQNQTEEEKKMMEEESAEDAAEEDDADRGSGGSGEEESSAFIEDSNGNDTKPFSAPLDNLAVSGNIEVHCTFGKGEDGNQDLKYSTCVDADSSETYYLLVSDEIKHVPEGSVAEMTLKKATDTGIQGPWVEQGRPLYQVLRAYSHDEEEVVPEIGEAATENRDYENKSTTVNLVEAVKGAGDDAVLKKAEREDRFFWQRGWCPKGSGPIRTAQACKLAASLLPKTSQWFDDTFNGQYGGMGYYPRYHANCHIGCAQKLYLNLDRKRVPQFGDLQVCDREALSLDERMYSTEATPVEDICPDVQFIKDKIVCDDGTVITDGDGSCCPASSSCPTSCAGKSRTLPRGSWVYKCYCSECTRARKVKTSESDEWVKAHNYLRCLHGQPLLHWDATVASNAIAPAQACCKAGKIFHSKPYQNTPSSGENLAMGYHSSPAATMAWYNEIITPGYPAGSDEPGGAGHYTAMIWKATTKLGCASCKDGKGKTVFACQYADAAPNSGHVPEFIQNVPQKSTLDATRGACCQYIFNGGAKPETRLEKLQKEAVAPYYPGVIKDAQRMCSRTEKKQHHYWGEYTECHPFTSKKDVVKACDASSDCLGYMTRKVQDGEYFGLVPGKEKSPECQSCRKLTYGENPSRNERFMVKRMHAASTAAPTVSPTVLPTVLPTVSPTVPPTAPPTASPTAATRPQARNIGADCWHQCHPGGLCDWCGSGACCRPNWRRDPAVCKTAVFAKVWGGHRCVSINTDPTPPPTPQPTWVSGLENDGRGCWGQCHRRGGFCDWCGSGACCRPNWWRDPAECKTAVFANMGGGHRCASVSTDPTPPPTPQPTWVPGLMNTGKGCWGQCHRRGGLCDWCGSGACCRPNARDPAECKTAVFANMGGGHRCVSVKK